MVQDKLFLCLSLIRLSGCGVIWLLTATLDEGNGDSLINPMRKFLWGWTVCFYSPCLDPLNFEMKWLVNGHTVMASGRVRIVVLIVGPWQTSVECDCIFCPLDHQVKRRGISRDFSSISRACREILTWGWVAFWWASLKIIVQRKENNTRWSPLQFPSLSTSIVDGLWRGEITSGPPGEVTWHGVRGGKWKMVFYR